MVNKLCSNLQILFKVNKQKQNEFLAIADRQKFETNSWRFWKIIDPFKNCK